MSFKETENPSQKHRAKKSLGQHFLRSQKALFDIVDVADLNPMDVVVEIGPGEGVLTKNLLNAGKVIAIEKDDNLAAQLAKTFADAIAAEKLEVLHQDVLDFDFSMMRLYSDHTYKVIANIPYNITGILIRNILTASVQPERMVLLIQKEVAERIVARDGKHSLLSLSVQVYGTPKIIARVPPGAFAPPPKVTSAIIKISDISRNRFATPTEEADFFALIHAGFAHKRKQLAANLAEFAPRAVIEVIFDELSLPRTIRAEDLSVDNWLTLTRAFQKRGILITNETINKSVSAQ